MPQFDAAAKQPRLNRGPRFAHHESDLLETVPEHVVQEQNLDLLWIHAGKLFMHSPQLSARLEHPEWIGASVNFLGCIELRSVNDGALPPARPQRVQAHVRRDS